MTAHFRGVLLAFPLIPCAALLAQTNVTSPSELAGLNKFAGTWVEDTSQRHVTPSADDTRVFEHGPDGSLIYHRGIGAAARSGTLISDGEEHPSTDGSDKYTYSFKQIDPNTWESVRKQDGQAVWTTRYVVSDGGKTLTITENLAQGNDTTRTVFTRASGNGNTLIGRWDPVSTDGGKPQTFKFTVQPDGKLTYTDQTMGWTFTAAPDGKEVPFTSPYAPGNFTAVVKIVNPTTLAVIMRRNGQTVQDSTFTLSADGKTITEIDKDPNSHREPSKQVFHKRPGNG